MINQQLTPYYFSVQEQACITAASNRWGSQSNCIKELKDKLNTHFDLQQNEKCCLLLRCVVAFRAV